MSKGFAKIIHKILRKLSYPIFAKEITSLKYQICELQKNTKAEMNARVDTQRDLQREIDYQKSVIDLHQNALSFLAKTHSQLRLPYIKIQQPLVSIIMAVLNREEFVSNAIESVLAQHYTNWELIIIDGKSTDRTPDIINAYANKDSRISWFTQEHSGICHARNLGLEKSQGEWIAYLDSDNTWLPHTLFEVIQFFLHESTCLAGYFAAIWHHAAYNRDWLFFPEKFLYNDIILHNKNELFTGNIDINCFVHHKSLYQKHGGFDVNLTRLEDFELTYRYLRHVEIKPIPIIGAHYYYCSAENALSAREPLLRMDNLAKIREKYQSLNKVNA